MTPLAVADRAVKFALSLRRAGRTRPYKSAVRGGREIVKKSILLCGACTGQGPEGGAGPGGTAREPGRPRERPLRVQKFLDKF